MNEKTHSHSGLRKGIAILLAAVLLSSTGFASTFSRAADEEYASGDRGQAEPGKIADVKEATAAGETQKKPEGTVESSDEGDAAKSDDTQKDSAARDDVAQDGAEQSGTSQTTPQENGETPSDGETAPAEESGTAKPLMVKLRSVSGDTAPEHHKYIKWNGEDSYTLTLDVKGMYDSETTKPQIDVLLIVDKSGSMDDGMSYYDWRSRLEVLQEIVTGSGGLSEAILENDQIDGQMAVVAYSGSKGGKDSAYNDATMEQDWTTSKDTLDASVNGIKANGGTNCQAGLYEGAKVLGNARDGAQKIVIFLSDGVPTYRYDKSGKTEGNGSWDDGGDNSQAAYDQVSTIEGLSGFYTVGITTSADSTFLQTLAQRSKAVNKGFYPSSNADELAEAFKTILANITEYTCRDVVITDTLSDYVELAELPDSGDMNAVVSVKDQNGDLVENVKVGDETVSVSDLITVSYDAATKTVRAEFRDGYALDQNLTYSVSFDVKPSQKAYDEYVDAGYNAVGSVGSDAPGNMSSVNQNGFYSNTEAVLTYTYGKEDDAQPSAAEYVEKPVIQVTVMQIAVEKVWKNTADEEKQDVTVNLYQDGDESRAYRTMTLNQENSWNGTFEKLAKGHTYSVKEAAIDGFASVISGSAERGFVITNTKLPALTISKEVKGELGDHTKAFPFTVKITRPDGTSLEGAYEYVGGTKEGVTDTEAPQDGSLTFVNGEAVISLKHGQTITLKGLPLGSAYEVVESGAEGYQTTYNERDDQKAQGVLNEDMSVDVINTKETVPLTGIEDRTPWAGIGFAVALVLAAACIGLALLRRRARR